MLHRDVFKCLNYFWSEGICNFRNDQAKDAALPRHQAARLAVRVVAEFVHNLPDAPRQLRIDAGDTIDGTRCCGRGYLGTLRDFANVHNKMLCGATEGTG